MSFRELLPPHVRDSWRFGTQQQQQHPSPPSPTIRVVAAVSSSPHSNMSSSSPTKSRRKKFLPTKKEKAAVRDWKDRIHHRDYCSASTTSSSSSSLSSMQTEDPVDRYSPTEPTQFAKLCREVNHFQKMVSDLHHLVPKAGDSPEIAWRVQILTKSLQDSDQALAHRLNEYERILVQSSDSKHPAQWSACRKLYRDYHRSHHTLRRCLDLYKMRQRAEISQLYAISWNNQHDPNHHYNNNNHHNKEDYFDRFMRQKELEKMNQSVHQVNEIYRELAQMIDQQQDDIDILERDIGTAAMNVESAAQHIHCFTTYRPFLCGGGGGGGGVEACGSSGGILGEFSPGGGVRGFDATVSFSDEQFQSPRRINHHNYHHQQQQVHRVGEDFHCMMPLETFQEDLGMVRQDIAQVGKNIWMHGEHVRNRLLGKNIR